MCPATVIRPKDAPADNCAFADLSFDQEMRPGVSRWEKVLSKPLPALPLNGAVLFPGNAGLIYVGQQELENVLPTRALQNKFVITYMQKDEGSIQLPPIGTLIRIKTFIACDADHYQIRYEALARVRPGNWVTRGDHYFIKSRELLLQPVESEALTQLLMSEAKLEAALTQDSLHIPAEIVNKDLSPSDLADFLAQYLPIQPENQLTLLAEIDPLRRLELVTILLREHRVVKCDKEREPTPPNNNDDRQELEIIHRMRNIQLPPEVRREVDDQLRRYDNQLDNSLEREGVLDYLTFIGRLPWSSLKKNPIDMKQAMSQLHADHYGLSFVTSRILEHLAVQSLRGNASGSIMCFVGPSGVGKTSIAQSIALATGRKYARLAVGGLRDEGEIRGHRRTYIGALPGQIIRAIAHAGTTDLVFVLDEIDKLDPTGHGDPGAALLEVLDPEQNSTFLDRYLDLPFDLSQIMFICTANTMNTIPMALADRMEQIVFSGYSADEKLEIARKHLLPKAIRESGLPEGYISITDGGLSQIIEEHTREPGVRGLKRELRRIARAVALKLTTETNNGPINLSKVSIRSYLGEPLTSLKALSRKSRVGLSYGLGVTADEYAGDVIPVEALVLQNGTGRIIITGNMGRVMKESAEAALSFAYYFGQLLHRTPVNRADNIDLHIHCSEGAVPKDGPSAGASLATAIFSAIFDEKVRSDIAMTGEINLHGDVLKVGGVKEKVLAAVRYGLKKVLVPGGNAEEIAGLRRMNLDVEIIAVSNMREVLQKALVNGERLHVARGERHSNLKSPKVPSDSVSKTAQFDA